MLPQLLNDWWNKYILQGLPTQVCLIYLDDLLVTGKSFVDNLSNLQQVLDRLRDVNLKLSPEKSLLCQSQVCYLGHIVGSEGVSTDPAKIDVVKTWPKPLSIKDVKQFLGFCSYYWKFVPRLTVWQEDQTKGLQLSHGQQKPSNPFKDSKGTLPKRQYWGTPMNMKISSLTPMPAWPWSCVVTNPEWPGKGHIVLLNQSEKHYCATRKELLAVIQAIKHFHPYAYGRRFALTMLPWHGY